MLPFKMQWKIFKQRVKEEEDLETARYEQAAHDLARAKAKRKQAEVDGSEETGSRAVEGGNSKEANKMPQRSSTDKPSESAEKVYTNTVVHDDRVQETRLRRREDDAEDSSDTQCMPLRKKRNKGRDARNEEGEDRQKIRAKDHEKKDQTATIDTEERAKCRRAAEK